MAFNTYINDRLNQWALWVALRASGGIGYPTRCAFVRLAGGDDLGSRIPAGVDEQAWEVEQAIQALRPELKDCVFEFYCRIGTTEQKARNLHCCLKTMYLRLDRAHGLILDSLNGYACGEYPVRFQHEKFLMQEVA